MTSRPLSVAIINAVLAPDCPLRLEVRALVVVMAFYADRNTGIGMRSQATIAAHLRTSDRNIRLLEKELAKTPGSPVAVVRRARQRQDGRGRTSDAYQLILTEAGLSEQPEPQVRVNDEPTGSPVPDGDPDQPEDTFRVDEPRTVTTNRKESHDQPEGIARPTGTPVPTIQSVDPVCGPVCDLAPASGASREPLALTPDEPRAKPPKRGRKAKPKGKTRKAPKPRARAEPKRPNVPDGSHARVTKHYHEAFEARNGAKPTWGSKEGELVWTLLVKLASFEDPAAEACKRIDNMFSAGWCTNPTIDLLVGSPDRFIASQKTNGSARPGTGRGPAQPNQTEKPSWLQST